ncbi:MAG: sigma-70 family RNA polymerase sigma factor [Planctomycetes bacterium]|nr:sigma-70 family RNA polymerase sigma factor [Planctomycetota bacterium]
MDEPSDVELLRRLGTGQRAGREAAFAELHRRHSRRSFQLAYRVLGDADLAADAVQEAFLSVFRKGMRFERRAQFTSWLFRVVLNRSIDMRRRERRGGATRPSGWTAGRGGGAASGTADGPDPLEAAPARGAGPEETARAAERDNAIRDAIARLSPKLAEVVALRYPGGLSYEEIGELLDVPPGTVRSRLNRAHAALRELLGPTLDVEDDRAGSEPDS